MTKESPRAIILAGGKGRRLYPYTTVFPKPLMPIGERPILEIVMRQLTHFGFQQVTMAVGYLAELIETYFGNGVKWDLAIDYSREEQPLGTAGPLKLVEGLNQDFLVMNGDILCSIDFQDMLDFHRKDDAIATVGTYQKEVKIDLGVLTVGNDYRIQEYIEKPTLHYNVSMGIYFFKPEVLNYIQPGEIIDLPDLILRLLEKGESVISYPFSGHWLDIGRQEDYMAAQEFLDTHYQEFHLET